MGILAKAPGHPSDRKRIDALGKVASGLRSGGDSCDSLDDADVAAALKVIEERLEACKDTVLRKLYSDLRNFLARRE